MSALLLLLLAMAPASPLDPLEAAVRARWELLDPVAGRPPADVRALRATLRDLEGPRDSLLDDLRVARLAARRLDRHWTEFDPDLVTAFDGLRASVLGERAALVSWMGRTGSDRGEARLDRGIAVVQRLLQRSDDAGERAGKAMWWRRACAAVEGTRRALRLDTPHAGQPPFAGLAPDFSLVDANPISPGTGLEVSPRDHLGRVTAWYFTRLG